LSHLTATARQCQPTADNVGAHLLATEAGVDDHQSMVRGQLAGGMWVTVRAARMAGAGAPKDEDVAVSIEPTSAESAWACWRWPVG
jgi:hypothetical protein